MRASVMIDLAGYTKEGLRALLKRCEEFAVQPLETRGESGGFDGESIRRLRSGNVGIFDTPLWPILTLRLPFHSLNYYPVCTFDISNNKQRLGHSEVELIQTMINGVNTRWKKDKALQKKYGT